MVFTVDRLVQVMEEIAPQEWAEDWDNVGLLVGNHEDPIERIMVALDISPSVVKESIDKKVDIIIAHHPLIFSPLKKIVGSSLEGQLIMPLLSHNIAVYCAHTNLDMARGGVDDALAKTLGLREVQDLTPKGHPIVTKPGFGRWGKLDSPKSMDDFAEFVGKALNAPSIEVIQGEKNREDKPINTVALCAGSGSDFMDQAKKVGADLFITGEIKYHDALRARWLGIDTMAVGHFYSEMPVIKELIGRLQTAIDSLQYKVEIIESEMQRSPYSRISID